MSEPLTLCLYNPDSEKPLHKPFDEIDNVHLIGQCSTWVELKDALLQGGINIVVVNLDAEDGVVVVERVTATEPTCGVIGVGSESDPSSIIRAMRAGCSQFVPWPVDPVDLRSAVERLRAARAAAFRESKRVCVVGASGGAGATTIACNLAMELGNLIGRRCALIDLNFELGDVGCCFDVQPAYSVADVCRDGVEPDHTMLAKAFHELPCNVSVLVRPERIEDAHEITPEGLTGMLSVAREDYPFVVLDLPRLFTLLSVTAVRDTEKVLIVTQLNVASIRNATRIQECLCQMGAPKANIEIVLNRYQASFSQVSVEDVKKHFGRPIFGMIPNDYRRIQSSLDIGRPIVYDAPNSPARTAIQEMARKLAADQLPDDPASSPPRGLLSRLWKRGPQGTGSPSAASLDE